MNESLCPNCEVTVADLTTAEGLARPRQMALGVKLMVTIDHEIPPCCEFAAQSAALLKEANASGQ